MKETLEALGLAVKDTPFDPEYILIVAVFAFVIWFLFDRKNKK